jgi:serine O-acetyltransferase
MGSAQWASGTISSAAGVSRRLRLRRHAPLARVALASSARDLILSDARKWTEYAPVPLGADLTDDHELVAALAAAFPEFRTLLYYRLSASGDAKVKALLPALPRIWRPHRTLRFHPGRLGPGCFILHGYSTGVAARSIGANFVVGQHVVIGYKAAGELPTIGGDVSVYVGAIVIGDVTIGDGAVVGARTVICKDVPAGAVMVGPAARQLDSERGCEAAAPGTPAR